MEDGEGLRKRVLEKMRKPDYQARTKGELARDLELQQSERPAYRAELARLVDEGTVVRGKKGRYKLRQEKDDGLLSGTLRLHSKGSAWFYPDLRDEANRRHGLDLDQYKRIYIPSRKTSVALDGDRVAVKVERVGGLEVGGGRGGKKGKKGKHGKQQKHRTEGPPGSEEGASGKVMKILERRSGVVVGTYMQQGKFSYVVPDDRNLPPTVELSAETTANPGQKVAVELENWERPQDTPRGKVVRILGYPDEAGVDILGIIEAHGLRMEFPPEVAEEARAVPDQIPDRELARRDDWREKFVFTIDPNDAKDFDDAICVKKVKDGWELAVHIADVAHYVKPDHPLDVEAVKRGNSTYLVDRVLPMLPPELSNGICSLRPNEDRLTCAAIIPFDESGRMGKARFVKAVICSKHRLTYAEAQEYIETGQLSSGDSVAELAEAIKTSWDLASLLRRRRFANGALDLDMAEIRLVLNEQGKMTGYTREEYNESHQLIEEFMLVANEAVARAIKNAQRPGLYRVHEDPDLDKLMEYTELARSHGYEPGDLTNRKHIQKLLDAAKGKPEEHSIKLGLLKSLKRAAYSEEPLGHYGLAKGDYCHFTSPIRRYADLIVHRSLEPLLQNPPDKMDRLPSKAHCAEIADHISTTERTSASAENESKRLKLLQWLDESSRSDTPPVFHAVVTDVRKMGLMVEATEIMQRGMVKRESFPRGDWRFEAHRMAYTSSQGELALNQVLPVIVDQVNVEKQFVDYRIVVEGEPIPPKRHSQERKPGAKRTSGPKSKPPKKPEQRKKFSSGKGRAPGTTKSKRRNKPGRRR